MQELLDDFVHYMKTELVLQLDMELAQLLVETLHRVLAVLIAKQLKGIDPTSLIKEHLHDVFVVALQCLAVFQNYRL